MAARLMEGYLKVSMTRDRDGHREYKVTHLVQVDDADDGPTVVLTCPGLPMAGAAWGFGNDNDEWATCKLDANVSPFKQVEGERTDFWTVEQTFSSKGDDKKCKDEQIDDPLLQPAKISITFSKYQEEAVLNLAGRPIVNSAFEPFKGQQVEFDKNRLTVKIEQNVSSALQGYVLPAQLLDHVSDSPLWGFDERCVKLSAASCEIKYWGSCEVYYCRTLEFEVRAETFDRDLLDESTKVLNGHWSVTGTTGPRWILDDVDANGTPPDPLNPTHFINFTDIKGNSIKGVLNGAGTPAGVKESGTPLEVLAQTNLNGGTTDNFVVVDVAPPRRLVVVVRDLSGRINTGSVRIVGTDDLGFRVEEVLDFNFEFGGRITTSKVYATVSNVQTVDVDIEVAPPINDPTIEVQADYTTSEEGKIHVVYYPPGDFLSLGIPLVF